MKGPEISGYSMDGSTGVSPGKEVTAWLQQEAREITLKDWKVCYSDSVLETY